jgi:fumarylacetoacetase
MTWLRTPDGDPWGIHNLPYGSVTDSAGRRFAGVRIGDQVLDLGSCPARWSAYFADGALDEFLAAGRGIHAAVRTDLRGWLTDPGSEATLRPLLHPLDGLVAHRPFHVADYVDFYAFEAHAANVGRMFRAGEDPLTPNWKHLPIGYHGRAGSVVASGTPVVRPRGQLGPGRYGPSERLDFEAEVGFVVGTGTDPASTVPAEGFDEHVFGVVLLNDWSARDIQSWEYRPLGPMLGKSFATSIGSWVTPLDALADAWLPAPAQDPPPLPYLGAGRALDLRLEVRINGTLVSRPPFRQMYWTPAQLLAHLTSNGAALRTGDLFASGTVSGPERDQRGCLLELGWNGAEPLTLAGGATRAFLADGDEVTITAIAPGRSGPVALAEVSGRVEPAVSETPNA